MTKWLEKKKKKKKCLKQSGVVSWALTEDLTSSLHICMASVLPTTMPRRHKFKARLVIYSETPTPNKQNSNLEKSVPQTLLVSMLYVVTEENTLGVPQTIQQ